jgi:outer membrane protein assembly factor BamB
MADSRSSSIQSWRYDAGSGVAAVSLSADGERVLVGTLGKTAVCLNSSGERLWQTQVGNQAWRAGMSGDGQTAVIGSGSTRFWDMKGRSLYCFNADGQLRWQQDLAASIWGLAVAADGHTIAAGTSARQILLFDGQGNLLWQQDIPGLGWYAWVWSAALSADGEVIAAGAADKRIRVFRRSGELLGEHRTRADVFATAVSGNGHLIVAGDSSGHIYCLDRQGNMLWEQALKDKVWAIAPSADGQRLLVGAGEKEAHIRLYNQAGQFLWKRRVGGSVTNVGLSADGRRIVAGTRAGGIFVFDEDQVLHQARAGKIVRDVAISAAGERVVAGSEDGVVYGFQLPPLPETKSPMTPAGTKYQINITGGQGIVIGDQAQVTQRLSTTGAPASPVSDASSTRLQHLNDNIQQDLDLLKECEDALRYEDDPRRRARYRREIDRLRQSAVGHKNEVAAMKAEVSGGKLPGDMPAISKQLQQMDAKLDTILQEQATTQRQLGDLRETLLARLDASEQAIVANVIAHLDQSQLEATEILLKALEDNQVDEEMAQALLTAVQQTLAELQQLPGQLNTPLAHDVQQMAEVVDAPQFDVRHKLKVVAPIIPFILSYEGELELNSSMNLETAWQRLMTRLRGTDE